jgi:hypothetical protein
VVADKAPSAHRVARQVAVPITEPPDRTTGDADVVEYDDEGRQRRPRPGVTYCRRLRCEHGVLVLLDIGESWTVDMGDVTIKSRGLPVLAARAVA